MNKPERESRIDRSAAIFLASCAVAIILLLGSFVLFSAKSKTSDSASSSKGTPTTIEGDKQIILMSAKNGFVPNTIKARAGVPMTLKVATSSTFDCSSVVNIPSLRISKTLPSTGETPIEIPAQTAGTILRGTCSMGMYDFSIEFS